MYKYVCVYIVKYYAGVDTAFILLELKIQG